MFYNPGALAFAEKKFNIDFGASFIASYMTYQNPEGTYTAESDNPLGTPFYFYGSWKVSKLISVGLSAYTPFGSTAKWDPNWAGKFLIQDISLKAIFIQPTISFNIDDVFGIGIGFVYSTGGVDLNKGLNVSNNSSVNLNGNASGMGFNVGLFFKATESLTFGVDYRSKINMKLDDGTATFTIPQSLEGLLGKDHTFDAELPLPSSLDFGVAYQFSPKLLLAFELDWVMWSAYESLDFTFDNDDNSPLNSNNPREYSDSFIPRFGIEYALMDNLTIRGGYYYDPSPANENYFTPETVTLNSNAFTLGLTWSPLEFHDVDISYLQTKGNKSTMRYEPDNFQGIYKTVAYIPGFGLSFKF
jgi:long-chain fatty acid transport protein